MHRNFPWSSYQPGAYPLCICFYLEHSHKKDYLLSTIWHLDLDALARYEPELSSVPKAMLKILKDCSHRVCPHLTFDSLQRNTRFTDHVTYKRQVLTTKCSRGCKITILCHSPKLSIRTIRNLGKGVSAADSQWLNQLDTEDVENAHHLINYPTPQEIARPPSRVWTVVIPPEKTLISKAAIHSHIRLGLLFIYILACLILLWDISSHPRQYRNYANRQLTTLRFEWNLMKLRRKEWDLKAAVLEQIRHGKMLYKKLVKLWRSGLAINIEVRLAAPYLGRAVPVPKH